MDSFKKEDWRFDSLPRANASDCFDAEASIFKLVRIDAVGFYDSVRKYNCRVCGHSAEKAYTVDEMNLHCSDPLHSSRVKVLFDAKQKNSHEVDRRLSSTSSLAPRVEQLGLSVWQHEIRSYFFQWVHSAGLSATPNTAFAEAYTLLKKYERLELSSLIELAAWKHACVMAGTESQMPSYLDMKEWERNGWKKNKTALRRSEATEVIVQNVLAFIDDSPLPTESSTTNRKRLRE